jgi:polysaccharide pyruvyl transferase WcaK-like protein
MRKDIYTSLPLFHFADLIRKNHGSKKLRGVIFGNFGSMNVGDEALLAGQLEELHRLHSEVVVVGRYATEIQKTHAVPAVSFYSLFAILTTLWKSDFALIGGGGLICRISGIKDFIFQLYMLFVFFFLPWILGKRMYVVGLGFYENAHPLIVRLTLFFLRKTDVLTVRDFHSYKFLQKLKTDVQFYKDNSFLMKVDSPTLIRKDAFFKKHYAKKKIQIGLSLVQPFEKKDEERLIRELTSFVEMNYQNSDFWFYATDYYPGKGTDWEFGKKIYSLLRKRFGAELRFHFVPTSWGPKKVFGSFQLMNFFVGMRLHSSIFCYRLQVPFVGVSYDQKCSSFLESIGKKDIPVSEVDATYLQKALKMSMKG